MGSLALGEALTTLNSGADTDHPPLVIFVSVHSAGVEVLCFDTVLHVFILRGLWGRFV
jgi:hypothetical protein